MWSGILFQWDFSVDATRLKTKPQTKFPVSHCCLDKKVLCCITLHAVRKMMRLVFISKYLSFWADLKCWWHLCVFFLPTYLFIPPWVCVSCCTAQCLWGVESYSPSHTHTHTHTHTHRCSIHRVKMKSNVSGVLTVVFLDLRRVTLHTTREREREMACFLWRTVELLSSWER